MRSSSNHLLHAMPFRLVHTYSQEYMKSQSARVLVHARLPETVAVQNIC